MKRWEQEVARVQRGITANAQQQRCQAKPAGPTQASEDAKAQKAADQLVKALRGG